MTGASKLRVGELLIQEGAITQENLERALAVQKENTSYKPIGEICVDLKFLSRAHLHRILNRYHKRISVGDLLINLGLITPGQLDEGLTHQKKIGGKLGAILVSKGFITEGALVDALSIQMGILKVAPDFHLIDKGLLKGINEEFLLSNEIIPAFKENDVLTLIMSNPLDRDMIQNLGRVFKVSKIKPAIASSSDIRNAIHQHFQKGYLRKGWHQTTRQKRISSSGIKKLPWRGGTPPAGWWITSLPMPSWKAPATSTSSPRKKAFGSDTESTVILHHKTDLPVSLAPSLASRIKVLCKLDIAEKRKHQDGRIHAQVMNQGG